MISRASKFIFFRLMGWTIKGDFPEVKKCIVAVVPHTRSMDFIIGVLTRAVVNKKISYVGKKELFNPITGWFFRALGGAPINRGVNENKVSAIARLFKDNSEFRMAIAPEGTRKKVARWKTGFYYIALEAEIPIFLVSFDYLEKKVCFLKLYYPSGVIEKDFKEMEAIFEKAAS
jgi:1-acyl-sn-glycerol-3-phosphate acyltransferase